ncbi:hypothetical protein CLD22_02835 [Rubrivivax gelatinosus]|nr:hypothetical protein [Rubrivivax gelatinosus]
MRGYDAMPDGQRGKFLERAKSELASRFGVSYVESIPADRFAGALEAAEQIVDAAIAELHTSATPYRRPHRQLPLVDTAATVPAAARAQHVANEALPVAEPLTLSSAAGAPLTMSSREIAELTGKEHRNVCRDIRSMLEQLGEDVLSFEHMSSDAYGRPLKVFCLPKDLTLTLVSGYSVPLRHRIVTRLQQLEAEAAGLQQPRRRGARVGGTVRGAPAPGAGEQGPGRCSGRGRAEGRLPRRRRRHQQLRDDRGGGECLESMSTACSMHAPTLEKEERHPVVQGMSPRRMPLQPPASWTTSVVSHRTSATAPSRASRA